MYLRPQNRWAQLVERSQVKHKLIEKASGAEVKPGMTLISHKNDMYKLISFRVQQPPSTGKVLVQPIGDNTGKFDREFYPSVFDLEIVEAE